MSTSPSAPVFETLVAAVTEAGLVETLSGDGPFTVFAPTDDAFAAASMLGLTAEELLGNPALADILTYHVVAEQSMPVTAISLDGQSAATVQGEEIDIAVVDGNVTNNATVVMPDVEASNGIIHVIDAVILPPTIAEAFLGVGDDIATPTWSTKRLPRARHDRRCRRGSRHPRRSSPPAKQLASPCHSTPMVTSPSSLQPTTPLRRSRNTRPHR